MRNKTHSTSDRNRLTVLAHERKEIRTRLLTDIRNSLKRGDQGWYVAGASLSDEVTASISKIVRGYGSELADSRLVKVMDALLPYMPESV